MAAGFNAPYVVAPDGIAHPPSLVADTAADIVAVMTAPSTPGLLASAVALLGSLRGPYGFHASATDTTNYRAVFARDAIMAGIAGLLLPSEHLIEGLDWTLEHLADLQGPEGQIASNFAIRGDGPPKVSFGTLAPRLDAAAWYLVGVGLGARVGAVDPAPHRDAIARVVRLLDGIEYNGRHLLYVPTGGDWADEWIYEGYVLHDQVLRAWGLRLVGEIYGKRPWREKSARITETIEASYWPADAAERDRPIAAFTPARRHDMFDLAACSLLGVSGLLPERTSAALAWIGREYLERDLLPPAFAPVIDVGHPDWPALERYQLHGFRNRPHEYHNGGIWPIWLGWLALALGKARQHDALARLRTLAADAMGAGPGFRFAEYLHGRTLAPGGTEQMAYTATGIVFLAVADQRRAPALFGE